jgi:organic hydroperoxide reductase OsmC/OhrA
MINYPIQFKTKAHTESGMNTIWKVDSSDYNLSCAIPPEFEGPGGALSPEDLYAQALTNCFIATFKVYAEKSKLSFEGLTAEGQLEVDLDESKKPWMKKFILKAEIKSPSSKEKAELLMNKAFKSGFILNSVKTELSFELKVI